MHLQESYILMVQLHSEKVSMHTIVSICRSTLVHPLTENIPSRRTDTGTTLAEQQFEEVYVSTSVLLGQKTIQEWIKSCTDHCRSDSPEQYVLNVLSTFSFIWVRDYPFFCHLVHNEYLWEKQVVTFSC